MTLYAIKDEKTEMGGRVRTAYAITNKQVSLFSWVSRVISLCITSSLFIYFILFYLFIEMMSWFLFCNFGTCQDESPLAS